MQNNTSIHRQRVIIVASVLLLHVLALWALQTGLLQRVMVLAEEIVVPVEFVAPAVPPVIKPPPVLPKPPPSIKTPVVAPNPTPAPPVAPAPAPMPLAIADPTPSANAPTGVTHAPAAVAPVVTAPSPPAPATAPKVESPTIDAEFLVRPNREYPRRCHRRGEQGKVVVRVLIGVDGNADKAEIATSSGYECLNREALDTAKSAKYKPVMRAGVPVEAWRETTYVYVLPE